MSTLVLETQGELTKELSSKRRASWIEYKQEELEPRSRCLCLLLSGKPAALFDHSNPDWTPHMGYEIKSWDVDRYHRIKKEVVY